MPKAKRAKKEVHEIQDKLSQIKNAIADSTDGMKSKAGELITNLLDDVKEKVSEQHEYVGEYAGNNPLRLIGVSLLVGGLLGWLATR